MDELKKAIALLFRRKGLESMQENELVLSASMDMGWFSPKEAKKMVSHAVEAKLLRKDDSKLRLAFDLREVEIPLDFAPSQRILKPPSLSIDLFSKLVDTICSASGEDRKKIVSRINAIQKSLFVEIEVAAVIVGKELGIHLEEFYDDVEKVVVERAKGYSSSSGRFLL